MQFEIHRPIPSEGFGVNSEMAKEPMLIYRLSRSLSVLSLRKSSEKCGALFQHNLCRAPRGRFLEARRRLDGLPIKFGMLLLGRKLHSEPRFTHSSLKRETALKRGIFGARRVLRPEIEAEGRLRLADVLRR